MKKTLITLTVICFLSPGFSLANDSGRGTNQQGYMLAVNEADQAQNAERQAAEERARQEKIEKERKESEERARQQKNEEERIRKEKIEQDQRQQDIKRQQELQEAEKNALEDRIRQEKIESDRREQELRRHQETEQKAYEERLRQEKLESDRKEKEILLRQQQMDAEKKAQEAALEKEKEEAKKQAEELRRQQQRLEQERKEEIRRNQIREQEIKKEKERLEEEKRRQHHEGQRHDSYHHDQHRHEDGYDRRPTIIYREENIYYSDPPMHQEPPVNVYTIPGDRTEPETVYKTQKEATGGELKTAKGIIAEILENEALEYNPDLSAAGSDFARNFMKSLKNSDGEITFMDPIVATDDPEDPELIRNFPCHEKTGITEKTIKKNIGLAGERKFRLYRIKNEKNKKKTEYDYIIYAEPFEASERPDLFPGYSRIDSSTCRLFRGLTVNSEDSDTGSFSTIIRYKKQYYVIDAADATTQKDTETRHIIRLLKYSEDKKTFEQDPYAYWSKSEPIN